MSFSEAKADTDSLPISEFRLPWVVRIMFSAAIVIPVVMIIYSSDLEFRALEESLKDEQDAKIIIAGERDVLALVAAEAAAEAGELSGKISAIAENKSTLEQQLTESGKWLADERRIRLGLQGEVTRLSVKMAAFQKREGDLQDIIELLEGEVASVEKRLEKVRAQETVAPGSPHIPEETQLMAPEIPYAFRGNEYQGNNHGSHDAQVIALLNEIGIMNGEIAEVREERNMLRAEHDRLATGKDESKVALRRSKKESKGRFAIFGKGNN